jgi:hypothetical protein
MLSLLRCVSDSSSHGGLNCRPPLNLSIQITNAGASQRAEHCTVAGAIALSRDERDMVEKNAPLCAADLDRPP